LFMHGKDFTVPKGTEVTAYVNGDFKIDAERFQRLTALQSGPTPLSQANSLSPSHLPNEATLDISSEPIGADIELDGNFVGNTPSVLGVSEGEHTLMLSKSGYGQWQRRLRVSTGNVKVMATMEVAQPRSITDHNVPAPVVPPQNSVLPPGNQLLSENKTADSQTNIGSEIPGSVSKTSEPTTTAIPNSATNLAEESFIGIWLNGKPTVRHDGVEIAGIQPGGPADTIGMKQGDRILAIDDHYLYTIDELRAELLRHQPGARLPIRYQRNRLIYDNYIFLLNGKHEQSQSR
jgi:hypothetical protein